MKTNLLILTFILFPALLFSQKYTISGYISDAGNNEKLIGANVYHPESKSGTITNAYGFYSITLPKAKIKLIFSFVGYLPITKEIDLSSNQNINIDLRTNTELGEVEVIANKIESGVESSQMSTVVVPIETIKSIPALLGEVDIIKAIQLLPGVQSGTEGSSGLFVRGGGPDQNLILLDGIPVYNVNHLFGFFSVFNADAINNVQIIKGGFPARYGGRLSSVLDIRMKEGNNKKIHGTGSIGLIAAKLALEGPIIKDKMSFLVSARRTYVDVLAAPIIAKFNKGDADSKQTMGYFFYDMTAKLNYKFNNRHRLYLSSYMGNDKGYMKNKYESGTSYSNDDFYIRWGNIVTSLRWNFMINNKLFSNSTFSYSKYKFLNQISIEYKDDQGSDKFSFDYFSGIEDYAAKIDFDYIPSPNHYIRFGANSTYHIFNPGVNAFKQSSSNVDLKVDTTFGNNNVYTNEMYTYVEDDITIGKLKVNAGVHASGFYVKKKFYYNVEPRLSMRYLIKPNWSVKAAFSIMNQYIHLLSNSSIGLPTDLWLPVTDTIKPQKSIQYAMGSVYNLSKGIEISIEGFYKQMDNLIAYKEGASYLQANEDWQRKIEIGRGWSYGAELLFRKKSGKTTGWVGYTLAWSNRQFENISFGEVYPYKYDRRHDISIVVSHKFSEKVKMGFSWVFGTGYAATLASEKYSSLFGNDIEYFPHRNSFRMPNYHRFDFSVDFSKKKKWGERTWSFGAYNVYSRKNPFFLFYSTNDGKKVLKQASLFPILPFVSYSFKF